MFKFRGIFDMKYVIEKEWESNGYKCMIRFTEGGYRCGYIGVPKESKLYCTHHLDYVLNDLDSIAHNGFNSSGRIGDMWYFGFDCNQYNDAPDFNTAYEYNLINKDERELFKRLYSVYNGKVRSLEYCEEILNKLSEEMKNYE